MQDAFKPALPRSVFSKASSAFLPPDALHWEWGDGERLAYQAMRQVGIIGDYVCGVMFRLECRLEASGIPYTVEPEIESRIMRETGHCRGDFTITLPESG